MSAQRPRCSTKQMMIRDPKRDPCLIEHIYEREGGFYDVHAAYRCSNAAEAADLMDMLHERAQAEWKAESAKIRTRKRRQK